MYVFGAELRLTGHYDQCELVMELLLYVLVMAESLGHGIDDESAQLIARLIKAVQNQTPSFFQGLQQRTFFPLQMSALCLVVDYVAPQ